MRDDLEIPYPSATTVQGGGYRPSEYRGSGSIDPNTKRMAIIAGSIGVALLLVMGIWSVTGHRHSGIPIVEADHRPVREKPINKGGLQVSGADDTILSGEADGKTVLAPAPEAPAIAALKATPDTTASAPVAAAPPASDVRVAGLAEVPLPRLPQANRSTITTAPAPAEPAPVAQKVSLGKAAPPAAPPSHLAMTEPAPHAATAGRTQVQLAAVGSEEAAMGEWQRLAHKYPDLLGSRHPAVSRTEHDGKTFYRLRVAGFADVASATSFCGQLHAKGGSCAVASF
jgi:hypothetical protein